VAGLRPGAFTDVGLQVTLCNPIRQVTPRSSEMGSHEELYSSLTFKTHFQFALLHSAARDDSLIAESLAAQRHWIGTLFMLMQRKSIVFS